MPWEERLAADVRVRSKSTVRERLLAPPVRIFESLACVVDGFLMKMLDWEVNLVSKDVAISSIEGIGGGADEMRAGSGKK